MILKQNDIELEISSGLIASSIVYQVPPRVLCSPRFANSDCAMDLLSASCLLAQYSDADKCPPRERRDLGL